MRKVVTILLMICMIATTGCISKENKPFVIDVIKYRYVSTGDPLLKSEIVKKWRINDEEKVSTFMRAITDTKKVNGALDIRPRDYSLKILKGSKIYAEYDLWIDEDRNVRGIARDAINNGYYYISVDSSSIIKEILKKVDALI